MYACPLQFALHEHALEAEPAHAEQLVMVHAHAELPQVPTEGPLEEPTVHVPEERHQPQLPALTHGEQLRYVAHVTAAHGTPDATHDAAGHEPCALVHPAPAAEHQPQ